MWPEGRRPSPEGHDLTPEDLARIKVVIRGFTREGEEDRRQPDVPSQIPADGDRRQGPADRRQIPPQLSVE